MIKCDDLKDVQPDEQEPKGKNDEKGSKNKKPWTKPVIKEMGEISVEDFIKLFKPDVSHNNNSS